MAQYTKASPYFSTEKFGVFLDIMTMRSVPKNTMDQVYTINNVYQYRPDLLANDLYGNSNLWWVFAARNPNVIQDPIFDFYPGQTIFLPDKDALLSSLGL
jgi:hypothetical protein